ncbi:hypothetical protein [Paenibacillus sp. YN15]|uniref:hypothetical protein n=1 Tax=Paenibacillus sp. YN15 TaxID=1742774 RepID=UPI000DCF4AE9|nr:hypothetical protein [Paenibacillus sp. YN15]RAU93578.1 hypothetical protein DQG13_25505 [Paenibacillus sp. YN15]
MYSGWLGKNIGDMLRDVDEGKEELLTASWRTGRWRMTIWTAVGLAAAAAAEETKGYQEL